MPDLTLAGTRLWRGGRVIERSGGSDRRSTGFKESVLDQHLHPARRIALHTQGLVVHRPVVIRLAGLES